MANRGIRAEKLFLLHHHSELPYLLAGKGYAGKVAQVGCGGHYGYARVLVRKPRTVPKYMESINPGIVEIDRLIHLVD